MMNGYLNPKCCVKRELAMIWLGFLLLLLLDGGSATTSPKAPDARYHSVDRPSPVQYGNSGESEEAVIAADDARCSEIGVSMLHQGGHAIDVAVPTASCLGIVYQMSSGIEGGGFMVVRIAEESSSEALA